MVPFLYIVTNNNIRIKESCAYRKRSFDTVFSFLRNHYPDNEVLLNRSNYSMSLEWAAHNLLWDLHIARKHTKSVDLNYPQKWIYKLGYFIVGNIALLFIK